MPRKRALDIAIAAGAVILLAALFIMRASLERGQTSVPSTYDTGQHGYAAVYALLARERVTVDRFEEPVTHIGDYRGTLVIAGDYHLLMAAPGKRQRDALETWVRGGGTLALLGIVPFWMRDAVGVPATTRVTSANAASGCGLALRRLMVAGTFADGFGGGCTGDRAVLLRAGNRAVAVAYRRGRGTVIFSPTTTILDNEHLAQRDNARFAYAILSRSPVEFEERTYGHAAGSGFWQVLPLPMRVAIIIACTGLLVGIAGANLPFAPPLAAPDGDERDSGEYIASLSRMLQRGGAQRAIVRRLCGFVETALGARAHFDTQARDLLERARALRSLSRPGSQDVIAAGRLFARVRKDFPW